MVVLKQEPTATPILEPAWLPKIHAMRASSMVTAVLDSAATTISVCLSVVMRSAPSMVHVPILVRVSARVLGTHLVPAALVRGALLLVLAMHAVVQRHSVRTMQSA